MRWGCRAGAQARSGLQVEVRGGSGSGDQAVEAEVAFTCAAFVHVIRLAQRRGGHAMRGADICSSATVILLPHACKAI